MNLHYKSTHSLKTSGEKKGKAFSECVEQMVSEAIRLRPCALKGTFFVV